MWHVDMASYKILYLIDKCHHKSSVPDISIDHEYLDVFCQRVLDTIYTNGEEREGSGDCRSCFSMTQLIETSENIMKFGTGKVRE